MGFFLTDGTSVVSNQTTQNFVDAMLNGITLDNLMGTLVVIAPILLVALTYAITKRSAKKAVVGVTKGKVNF